MNKKKIAIVILFITTVALFFVFDVDQYLNLEYVKSKRQDINDYYSTNPVKTALIYVVAYILVAGAALPWSGIMTIVGGAVFGVVWGTVLVSFASVIGATIAFLITRYLLHDHVQQRFGKQLAPINRGIKEEGLFYLFTMRLVPLFPFFIINILMALTPIRMISFALVSQAGMLLPTIIFINAGTQLGKIESLGDVLSSELIFSFVLLGVFPLIAKKIVVYIKKKQNSSP